MTIKSTAAMAAMLLAGCATPQAPSELINARMAYARVSGGAAAQVVPDEVHKARVALDSAERSFSSKPEDAVTRDLAYIAERKSQLAEAKGQILIAGKSQVAADKQLKQTLSDQKDQATSDAEHSRQQAAQSEEQRRVEAGQHATAMGEAQARTDAEASARVAAEAQVKVLMSDLALLGKLHDDARGTVITLSGDVVFVTNQWTVLASARPRLDKLADVLKPGTYRMVIEGHTDSRGSDARNQDLSTRRAEAVRDYLVARGVSTDRIVVTGFGKSRPVADNASAEGRAMNRRVEIIVEGLRTAQK